MQYAPVVIEDSDLSWPHRYEEAKIEILAAIGQRTIAIEHIGSTAVPDLGAKPLIDILVAVRQLPQTAEACIAPLARIGFEYVPKPLPARRFFRRGPWGAGTHHLHMVEWDGEEWRRPLLFRDYLRQHPETRRRYETLKRRLAAEFGANPPAYTAAKDAFITEVLAHANIERQSARRTPTPW